MLTSQVDDFPPSRRLIMTSRPIESPDASNTPSHCVAIMEVTGLLLRAMRCGIVSPQLMFRFVVRVSPEMSLQNP
jgi:hypothetical protein